ncbi:hypothetical protein BS78_K018600 [Paspalum vaginatum]|uniref:Uncharacterized protein n=1 Tax=Paspalum vaginatum TaxID=158149 RepID=A0A9W7XF79_9POAL|nr:hypothetical protein BS78_K018600 [Paspalum vaginatum]
MEWSSLGATSRRWIQPLHGTMWILGRGCLLPSIKAIGVDMTKKDLILTALSAISEEHICSLRPAGKKCAAALLPLFV